jgi:hypothetical protein
MKYGGGTFVSGTLDLVDITIAGLQVKNQEIGLVNSAYRLDGRYSSGILGLAFAARTSAYVGTDSSIDNRTVAGTAPGERQFYSPIVETMIAQGLHPPVFSLALQRPAVKNTTAVTDNEAGGYISFGGLPPVNVNPLSFVSTPLLIVSSKAVRAYIPLN